MSEQRIEKFQPGDEAYVRLVFRNAVSIKNIFLIFVHEKDADQHIVIRSSERSDGEPLLRPGMQTILDFSSTIQAEQRPGIYVLDKVSFESFGGRTSESGSDRGIRFEVIPERDFDPVVEGVSVFNESLYRTIKEKGW